MNKFLVLLLLVSKIIISKDVQKEVTNEDNFKKLFELIFSKDQVTNLINAMLDETICKHRTKISKEKLFNQIYSKMNDSKTITAFTDIYKKHFTDEEIKEILSFYETSVGKKCIAKMGDIVIECSQIGTNIAQEVLINSIIESPENIEIVNSDKN